MPRGRSKRARRLHRISGQSDQSKSVDFKCEIRALRGIVIPSTAAPDAKATSKAMNPPKADELRALIRTGRESMDLLVSHPVRMSSTYSLDNLVDFILYGRIVGGPLWQLSHASRSLRGCSLKGGLPAGHLGLDQSALGAKFCIKSRESEVGSSSTAGYNPFLDKVEKIADFDKTRYFH